MGILSQKLKADDEEPREFRYNTYNKYLHLRQNRHSNVSLGHYNHLNIET